ncbi:transcription initiation factor IIA subunit 1 [Tribolium madens]|uniref:transcription initiation factor IIA subunit 1 n=1 Tax=Tribolium madens TaxID=41895 RepID=UPI001CF763C0|nr:transcription initiation factor IIA subunit 1 [Tribolium madens]
MSNSLCKTSVLRIYQEVIDDVISGVREIFLEDGVDEQVLQELKQTWETKLKASKAVQTEEEKAKKAEMGATNGFPKQHVQPAAAAPVGQLPETKMVPIQITLPAQPGSDQGPRILTIQVPATALQGNQLQKVLTGQIITGMMNLPANIASSVLQQHVNAVFNSQQQQIVTIVNRNIAQTDGNHDEEEQIEIEFVLPKKKVPQVDGPVDTSDDDEDGSDDDNDDDDIDDEKDEEDQEMEEEGGEEEPLNSEDDVTDDDPTDLFDTDNIVVCQYDKIIRNRNKWKFYLKDGIMNLSGQDYVFQKANGDAEW